METKPTGMISRIVEAKLECKNVSCEKIANCLSKSKRTFPFEYKVWVYKNSVFAYFKVRSMSDLNELARRLRRIKKSELTFHQIQKVWV